MFDKFWRRGDLHNIPARRPHVPRARRPPCRAQLSLHHVSVGTLVVGMVLQRSSALEAIPSLRPLDDILNALACHSWGTRTSRGKTNYGISWMVGRGALYDAIQGSLGGPELSARVRAVC